jgi:uncharacterized protein with ACT and thioredoxin-like domain
MDEVGITKAGLDWTSIDIEGNAEGNRPGVLARLAGLVSDAGGNIVRTVNNTRMDGSFTLRLVLKKLPVEKLGSLREAYQNSGIGFTKLDIV